MCKPGPFSYQFSNAEKAVTAIHAIPYLATWNFAHLANPRTRPKIEQICRAAGYVPPYIGSPQAIMEELP